MIREHQTKDDLFFDPDGTEDPTGSPTSLSAHVKNFPIYQMCRISSRSIHRDPPPRSGTKKKGSFQTPL